MGRRRRPKAIESLADLADFFEAAGDDEAAARFRLKASDAGRYLEHIAGVSPATADPEFARLPSERVADYVGRALAVYERVERTGLWEETTEWRISTFGAETIERLPEGVYRARSDYHGTFGADFVDFADAFEALAVFTGIQRDLFWSVGWSSWASRGQLHAGDPAPTHPEEPDERHEYLMRLARDAEERARELIDPIRGALDDAGAWTAGPIAIRHADVEWDGTPRTIVEYDVQRRSLTMSSQSPTLERALTFVGIYDELQTDLEQVLGWRYV